jgi:hypothetical protein
VQQFLHKVALLAGDAEGEIECRIIDDDTNDKFEFYSIKDSRLLCQAGRILREENISIWQQSL